MKKYNPEEVEKKWQKYWDKNKTFVTPENSDKPKYYVLDMFPYPSGAGLHVGHPKGYIATDVIARLKMMQGYNVLHPMGWDAFGLPAENYALKNKVHPAEATAENIATFKKQLELLGFTYDWNREVTTTDPAYYKWTQWAFLQMFKHGLAFESHEPIIWCPTCKTGLAQEDLENGKCERCSSTVERKPLRQWVLRITNYADRLLKDLDKLSQWPQAIVEMQRNWIGRSEGAEIDFVIKDSAEKIKVFTSRPDTLFGVTYLVVAPEHKLLSVPEFSITNRPEVVEYVQKAKAKSDLERTELQKDKTGVELKDIKVINPVNGEEVPVFVADYVLGSYGTGAIMAVPAHDERDFAFAKKYNLAIREVVEPLAIKKDGDDAFRPDAPIKERRAVVCVIKHWSEDKYLGFKWIKNNWQGFVIGGIEKDETTVGAGSREIIEETGYKNIEFVKNLGGVVNAKFFQCIKGENRVARFVPLLFKLKDGEMLDVSTEEKSLRSLVWLTKEEMDKFVNYEDMKIIWRRVHNDECYSGYGILANSGKFTGMESEKFKEEMTMLAGGKMKTNYKLRDWVFSRQRYWGEPIPLVNCEKCGWVPVPESELPLELPKVKNYEPTGTGESPLANIAEWVNTTCPKCGGFAKRETNTMPQWAGSCWYYLRYEDPKNNQELVSKDKEKYWNPVDLYVGGAEHATRHLIYARFWHKFLFDIGVVSNDEPFRKLQNVGLILAEDGRKMSKRWGNVINPDDIVAQFGADAMRMYEMFMGPFDQAVAWDTKGLVGVRRFLDRVWSLQEKVVTADAESKVKSQKSKVTSLVHLTIKKVSEDIESLHFNTAIAKMMELSNEMMKEEQIDIETYRIFVKILSPFAPHMTEELWQIFGGKSSIITESWPKHDAALIVADKVVLAIQVNGKLRDTIEVETNITEAEAQKIALASEKVQKHLEGKQPKKIIYVKGKLVSIVV